MRHYLVDNVPLLLVVVRADLRRERQLLVVVIGAFDDVQVDVGGLAGEDLGGLALLAEVYLRAVDLVHQHGGDEAHDLQGEVLRLDDVDGRDERVHDEGQPVRVLDRDGVGLALDDDGRVAALADEDRVGDLRLDRDRW